MQRAIFVLLLGLIGCQAEPTQSSGPDPAATLNYTTTPSTHPAAKKAPALLTEESVEAAPADLPAVDFIRLERGPCFGNCPVFQATLLENGELQLRERNQSIQRIQRTPTDFLKIARLLEQANVLRFASHYDPSNRKLCPNYRTDHPSTSISLRINGQTHTIAHYHGCVGFADEAALLKLEADLQQAMQLPFANES